MYSDTTARGDGLGVLPIVFALIAAGATIGGTVLAAKIMAGAGPDQKEIEAQLRLQQQLQIEQQTLAHEQTIQTTGFLLPAVGALALVMLLR